MGAAEQSLPEPPLEMAEDAERAEDHGHVEPADWYRLAVVGGAAALSWFHATPLAAGVDLIAVAAALIGGYPVFHEAVENIAAKRMTMELSMTMALAAAMVIGEFSTALFILFFVLIAEMLEGVTVGRGRSAIRHLLEMLPRTAFVRRDGAIVEVPAAELRRGDLVIVKPGAEIPVDGVVVQGASTVNQAHITGESTPVHKLAGAAVFAGTTNQSGMLEIETERLGRETIFGRIIEAVEKTEQARAPIQKLADRLAAWLVYFALASALVTFLVTHNARSTIAVIIVAGACGIAAGTPLAVLGAIGRAAYRGAIVKGGRYMEALGTVDTVVLDKTGTLTFGEPEVTTISPAAGVDPQTVLQMAAIAEGPSEHPLAKAVLRKAAADGLSIPEPEAFEYSPGEGVRVRWKESDIVVGSRAFAAQVSGLAQKISGLPTEDGNVFVVRRNRLIGSLQTTDRLRPEAVEAVSRLRGMGLRVILLTGDHVPVAAEVARQLKVDEFEGELLPEQKLARIQKLIDSGQKVAMVGDGFNDAPALACATVGIAMGSGTDLARQTASVLLIGNNLLDLVELLNTARRARGIVMFNFAGTLAVDAAGVALAAIGVLSPLLAAIVHVSSELAFILNSARLVPATTVRSRSGIAH